MVLFHFNDLLSQKDAMSGNVEQDRLFREILVEKVLRAADCSIISLIIMTSSRIPKELVVEDIIEQIAVFVKLHLTETLFPHHDPVYKSASTRPGDAAAGPVKSKRKLANQFDTTHQGAGQTAAVRAKSIQHLHNRVKEILGLLASLVGQIDMTDTIVITLSSLSVACFFVENISDLQLEALRLLTNLFTRYSKHRQLVLDDLLGSLVKVIIYLNKKNKH